MISHERFLELAAAAIDFELEPEERAELDRHLAECDSCRRTAEAFRDDAATIAYGPGPRLESGQSVAILAAALRPPKSGPAGAPPCHRRVARHPGHGTPGRRHGDPPPLE